MFAHGSISVTRVRAFPALVLGAWLIAGGGFGALAAGPAIEFDIAPAVECRDVTPPEFAETHADQRIVEATVQISFRLTAGNASDVREVVVEINGPEQRMLILDYTPNQLLESSVEGPIEVTETHEAGSTLGGGLSGGAGLPFGPITAQLSPNAAIGKTQRDLVTEQSKKVAPKNLVAVGGTMNSGYGVFFKLRPSLQTPLEGRKEFVCRYVVPANWRGDWLTISARATGQHTQYFLKTIKTSGQMRRDVGIYLAGDREARRAAWRLAAAQRLVPAVGEAHVAARPATYDDSTVAALKKTADAFDRRQAAREALERLSSPAGDLRR